MRKIGVLKNVCACVFSFFSVLKYFVFVAFFCFVLYFLYRTVYSGSWPRLATVAMLAGVVAHQG